MLKTIIEKLYVDYPARASRFVPLIGSAASDSVYLTAWPLVALIAPLLAFAFGFSEGAFHWTHANIWDGRVLAGPPGIVFMQMLPLLIVAAAVGALSSGLGLLLVVGYALGDIFVAGTHFWGRWHPHPMMWSLIHITVPQLITYLVFFLLAVQPALTSRALVGSLPRLPLPMNGQKSLLAVLCAAIQGAMVYAWTIMAPMSVRPIWLWHNAHASPVTVQYFMHVALPLLPLVACGFVLVRALMVAVASQNPQTVQSGARLAETLQTIAKAPRKPSLALLCAGTLISALTLTLLLSGLYAKLWPVATTMFALILAILALRSIVLPMAPPWRAWAGIAERIPLFARWLAASIGGYIIGRIVVSLPGQSVFQNERTGAFGAELSAILIGLALAAVLFPSSGGLPRGDARKAGVNFRMAAQTAGFIVFAFLVFHPSGALANCVAARCCFTSNGTAALYVAGGLVLIVAASFFGGEAALAGLYLYSGFELGKDLAETGEEIAQFAARDHSLVDNALNIAEQGVKLAGNIAIDGLGDSVVERITGGALEPIRKALQAEVGSFVSPQFESRFEGLFDGLQIGNPGDPASKYLWTIDGRGVNIAPASSPFATPSGTIVDSNMSPKAYVGGEAWFGPNNTVTLNTGSGRFGVGASPEKVQVASQLWQNLGYTPSFSSGPTIPASSAPTKYWELESIARTVPNVVQSVAAQKPEWSRFADLHGRFNDLVSQQDRASLDQSVPDDLVTEVLGKLHMTLYQGADGRVSTQQMSPADQPISAFDVFKKYGGNFLENVLEHGSELAV